MIVIIKYHTAIKPYVQTLEKLHHSKLFIFNKMVENIPHILERHRVYASQIHFNIYDPTVIIMIIICDECLTDDLAKARW